MKTLYALVGAIGIGISPVYGDNSTAQTTPTTEVKNIEELLHVTDSTFDKEVLQSKTPVIVDFYSEWCGPCRMLAPIYADTCKQYDNKLKFTKMNTSNNNKMSNKYNIQFIPTLVIFEKGKEISRHTGYLEKEELVKFIDKSLGCKEDCKDDK